MSVVRNLVIDYSRAAEYESFSYNKSIIEDVTNFYAVVKRETTVLGIMSIFSILIFIASIFFIQKRIINRLILMNRRVQARLLGEDCELTIDGHDEITDIATSFEQFAKTIEQQKQALENMTLIDSLTNIANRRSLDIELTKILQSAYRMKRATTILMMDIDNFKLFNDMYGHVAGDKCLQQVAMLLKHSLRRPEDFVARYGGEEFVCILPDTAVEGALVIAQSILDMTNDEGIPHQANTCSSHVTLSIGVATYYGNEPSSGEAILKEADAALYQAKAQGKNRYVVSDT